MGYHFAHVKKGDIAPMSEEKAFEDFVAFLRGINDDGKEIIIFMHSKEAILPLLLSKIAHFRLETEFNVLVKGFCDLNTCVKNLKLGGIWKNTKFVDLSDVYKHITGRECPKEARHCDGVSVLCGSIIRKMVKDYTDYFKTLKFVFSPAKFFNECGKQTSKEFRIVNKNLFEKIDCRTTITQFDRVEAIEFSPSDRPDEVTIVNLKKFDIVDVIDDEEEEDQQRDRGKGKA